jgi:hypothetical protein
MRTSDLDDEEPTPLLREALAALPREREPGRLLEERTVRALRERGMIAAAVRRRPPAAWLGGAAAAGVALFLAGLGAGQSLGARQAAGPDAGVEDPRGAATAVQETGTAYVQALARLASQGDASGAAASEPGREVAVRMLRAAADELLRIAPDDPVAAAVLQAFQRDSAETPAAGKQRVVWF